MTICLIGWTGFVSKTFVFLLVLIKYLTLLYLFTPALRWVLALRSHLVLKDFSILMPTWLSLQSWTIPRLIVYWTCWFSNNVSLRERKMGEKNNQNFLVLFLLYRFLRVVQCDLILKPCVFQYIQVLYFSYQVFVLLEARTSFFFYFPFLSSSWEASLFKW